MNGLAVLQKEKEKVPEGAYTQSGKQVLLMFLQKSYPTVTILSDLLVSTD